MRFRIVYLTAITGFFFDQISKAISRHYLVTQSVDFGVIRFDLVFNKGAAWGIFSDHTQVLTFLGVAAIAFLLYSLRDLVKTKMDSVAVGCLLAGALGNTFDRLLFGRVTDFINIHILPVFNVADMLLNCGILLIILQSILDYMRRKA
ncbi:MAG: signal peptidase II [Candidatus Marinamargulisbacteria bacterium]